MHRHLRKNIAFQSSQQNNSSINFSLFLIFNKSSLRLQHSYHNLGQTFGYATGPMRFSGSHGSSSSFRNRQETVRRAPFPIRHCKCQCFLPTGWRRHSSLPADTMGRLLSRWWPMRWLMLSNTWSFVRTFKEIKTKNKRLVLGLFFIFMELFFSILPFLRGPPAAGVWQVRCACRSGRKSLGWWCSYGPGSPRPRAAASRRRGGSSRRGTTTGPPAPPAPWRPASEPVEGWSCPPTPPCGGRRPATGSVPGTAGGTATGWHPQRALR